IQPSEIVDDRRVEEQAIETVKQAAVTGKNLRRIFRARATFECALCQISEHAEDIHRSRQRQCSFQRQFWKEPLVRGDSHQQTRKDRKSTRLNSSHLGISYAVFCLKK